MYQRLYAETSDDTAARIREDEVRAFRHAIALLEAGERDGPGSRAAVEALFFLNRLWAVLLEDLASPGNGLPPELRAKLISIGIWMLKRAEAIRRGEQTDLRPLIDISNTIAEGLRASA